VLRTQFLQWLNNAAIIEDHDSFSYRAFKEHNYESLANVVEQQVNIKQIFQRMEIPYN
jgi:cobyric acid synthase